MRITAAFLAHELRTQLRSLRFRAFAAAYVGIASLPAAWIYWQRARIDYTIGASSYASETVSLLPLLTAVFAILLSLDGITREQGGGAWTTVTLAGMTNAGYLLRRWLALQAVILPLTAVPLLIAAALAQAAGDAVATPAAFWGPWLVRILPLAFLGSTLGLALGTLGGGGMSTFVVGAVAIFGIPDLLNLALSRFGYWFSPVSTWLGGAQAQALLQRIGMAYSGNDYWLYPNPASEGGYDLASAAEQSLAEAVLPALLSIAALGLSIGWLRRTRPDVRPRFVRADHPLRSFLGVWARLRERLVPDPAPAPADRLALTLALLLAAAAGGLGIARAHHYDELAWERDTAERSGLPAPTSREVVPGRWHLAGRLGPGSEVALEVRAEMRNTGRKSCRRLVFQLNPHLVLEGAGADAGGVRARRAWDRLELALEPPIPPGGRRELVFRLRGSPRFTVFPDGPESSTAQLRGRPRFLSGHQRARFGRDLVDYSLSYTVPAISGYRVDLEASDLTPVPRYGGWTRSRDGEVPPESFFPTADLELSLATPPDLFLADTCGGMARRGFLKSRCNQALSDVMIAGGRQRILAADAGGATVAVFPAHRRAGELHLGSLSRRARLFGEAWPGSGGLEKLVILEWPAEGIHDQRSPRIVNRYFFYGQDEGRVSVQGRLVFVRETDLLWSRPLPPEGMVAEIVASRLMGRRRIAGEEQLFFRQLLRRLALQRLGLGSEGGAVVGPVRPQDTWGIREPALHPEFWGYWQIRFPALVAALERRAGAEALRASIDEFLSRSGEPAGSFAELAEIVKRRSEAPVDGMLRDFFLDGKMPELLLEGVEFHRAGGGWAATGRVRNAGDGEAVCRLVLTTDMAPAETAVRTGTGESAAFSLVTPYRPQAVLLDPDRECHRLVRMAGTPDRVYFKGETR